MQHLYKHLACFSLHYPVDIYLQFALSCQYLSSICTALSKFIFSLHYLLDIYLQFALYCRYLSAICTILSIFIFSLH
jgi:hypothetical protein